MLRQNKIVCCFFYGVLSASVVFGQYKFEKPVVIGKKQGYQITDTRRVAKGKDGFMWMGSAEGLCRFDGQQLKIFSLTNDLDKAPFNNTVYNVLPLEKEIWMTTEQGLSVMNNANHTFRHYQFTATGKADSLEKSIDQASWTLFRDRSGKIWVGNASRNICMYDEAKDNFRFFRFREKSILLFSLHWGPTALF